jgi:hypothetical protein
MAIPIVFLDFLYRYQVYNFDIIAKQIGLQNGFFLGSGAGNSRAIGTCCEVISTAYAK